MIKHIMHSPPRTKTSRASGIFRKLTPVVKAKRMLLRSLELRPKVEDVKLFDALGRISAEDVKSPIDNPPFDKSAMDGYAVRARDTFGASEESPINLKLVGSIEMGEKPKIEIRKGECVAIPTGAPLPPGADAVIEIELTGLEGNVVNVRRSVAPNENVVLRGSDVKKSDVILRKGKNLLPKDIGLLATVGLNKVAVFQKPTVAIVSTGNELVEPGSRLEPGQIYDSNSTALYAHVAGHGGTPILIGRCKDDPGDIQKAIEKGLGLADAVIVTGSVSVGAKDVLQESVDLIKGSRTIVHGIAMKPGKPTMIATAKGKPIFCLPGNPTSALASFYVFVRPVIQELSQTKRSMRRIRAILAERIFTPGGRHTLVFVRITKSRGKTFARPIPKGSSAMTTFATGDGFIEIPPDVEFLHKGDRVTVNLFGE